MKKCIALLLILAMMLGISACGTAQKDKDIDVGALYDSLSQYLPEMFTPDEETLLNFLGVHAEDCTQYRIALCAEGLRADEVWLVQAKDQAALERLQQLANNRIESKKDETESYVPDQYLIVKQAQVLTHGLYLAFFISPDVEQMATAFEAAFK